MKLSGKTTSLVGQRIFTFGVLDIRPAGRPAFPVTSLDFCDGEPAGLINQHLATIRDAAGKLLVHVPRLATMKVKSV